MFDNKAGKFVPIFIYVYRCSSHYFVPDVFIYVFLRITVRTFPIKETINKNQLMEYGWYMCIVYIDRKISLFFIILYYRFCYCIKKIFMIPWTLNCRGKANKRYCMEKRLQRIDWKYKWNALRIYIFLSVSYCSTSTISFELFRVIGMSQSIFCCCWGKNCLSFSLCNVGREKEMHVA